MKPSRRKSTLAHEDDEDHENDDNDFGDDFDEFEEGAQEGADDDFGDFDDGFQEPEAVEESPPVPTAQTNTIPADPFVSPLIVFLQHRADIPRFTAFNRLCRTIINTGSPRRHSSPLRRHVPGINTR